MKNTCIHPASIIIMIIFLMPFYTVAQFMFERTYPATYDRTTRDIVETDDGGFLIVGAANNSNIADCDLYVMKTDNQGNLLWDKIYGGAKPDYAYSIVKAHDGNYIIAGFTQSYGGGDYDMYILKIAPDGTELKYLDIGDGKNEEAREIIRTKDNKYVIVGSSGMESSTANQQVMVVRMDVDLNVEKTWYYGGPGKEYGLGIQQTPDDGFIICGQTFSKGNGGGDAYLLKIASDGTEEWSEAYGGAGNDEAVGIVVNSDGTYVFAVRDSSTSSDIDIRVFKTSNTGSVVWEKHFGGVYKDTPKTIKALGNGEYIVGAISRSFNNAASPDAWLIKVKDNGSSGEKVWDQFYGDPVGHDHCHMAKPASDGGLLVVGHTRNPKQKVYFLKLNSEGKLIVSLDNDNLVAAGVMVFPNPVSGGMVKVKNNSAYSWEVEVLNVLGQKAFTGLRTAQEAETIEIDLSGKPAGVYFVSMYSDAGKITRKILVE